MSAMMEGQSDYGSTESTPTQFDKIAKDLMSEGLSIGKALAEQGKGYYEEMKAAPKSLYFMSLVGGVGMFVVSAMGLVLRSGLFHSLIQIYLAIFGLVICALEMKDGYFSGHPEYKAFVAEYFHFVFTFYGRAVFYVFCATMLLGQFPYMPDMIVGLYMAFLAGMYITMGFKSSKKLKELKIQGEEEAKSVFGTYAQDGVLDKVSFGELLSKMGFEFSEQEIDAALMMIAGETKDTISEDEFVSWHATTMV
eukprot:CAMPEP_0119487632 /NCGR_PEP_ID=MMETSP1344-20130328/13656_1 /TAXON_ID=236787 /ORGANISM="Florenciella parvula, Strain CCMP2471" /LENGTH=250 /DNA_ID=CAMNT_0007522505 /DNA_START=39 /DNA_END=791 /DNA_ORIENTATION=+